MRLGEATDQLMYNMVYVCFVFNCEHCLYRVAEGGKINLLYYSCMQWKLHLYEKWKLSTPH